tara:strand:- start:1770 stop:2075 length:306 start_codon:yes stop_codon:yes gene_type:complete
MDRYTATKKYNDLNGKHVYKTTVVPTIPIQDTDLYLISREGDRLDLLSNEFYHDISFWWVIAEANGLGKGTISIEPGIQIRIPLPIKNNLFDLITNAEKER